LEELFAKAMQGVDPNDPSAFWQIFRNLMAAVPWWPLVWATLTFVVVGGLLGWWRGRFWLGVTSAAVLGPLGWLLVIGLPRRTAIPPPLPPPLSGQDSKKPPSGPML
jgi:hypothetical protein